MSHGSHDDIRARHKIIRADRARPGRPIGILADLQGPKLRVRHLRRRRGGAGARRRRFRFDLDQAEGDATAGQLPHKEIFEALEPGATLLVNDGKIRLKVEKCGPRLRRLHG